MLGPAKNLPGAVKVPMATGRPKAAFVLDLVRRSDLPRGEQLDSERSALGEADCRTVGRAEPLMTWRRPRSEPHAWNNRLRSPQGVEEGSMLARNESQNAEPLGSRLGVVCRSKGVWYRGYSRLASLTWGSRAFGEGRRAVTGPENAGWIVSRPCRDLCEGK